MNYIRDVKHPHSVSAVVRPAGTAVETAPTKCEPWPNCAECSNRAACFSATEEFLDPDYSFAFETLRRAEKAVSDWWSGMAIFGCIRSISRSLPLLLASDDTLATIYCQSFTEVERGTVFKDMRRVYTRPTHSLMGELMKDAKLLEAHGLGRLKNQASRKGNPCGRLFADFIAWSWPSRLAQRSPSLIAQIGSLRLV